MGRPSKLHRHGKPDGFYYADAEGMQISDDEIIKYIGNLVIPPAW